MKPRIADHCVCCNSKNLKSSPAVLMPFIAHRTFGWAPVEIDDSWGLRSIKQGMAYSICNSLQCTDCNHLFLDIRFTDNELEKLYQGYREKEYIELRDKYEPGYKAKNESLNKGYNYIDKIEEFLRPFVPAKPAILDWGGDSGINTPFKSSNNCFHIYEISDRKVIDGATSVTKAQARETSYDLVICSNVLEHIPYPAEVLKDLSHSLNKDTTLYIELPYEELMRITEDQSELCERKKHWHEHINFYSEQSISALLKANNFSVLELNKLPITGETTNYIFQIACRLN